MKTLASPPALSLPLRLHTKLVDLWFAAQVELHGHYSVKRLESLYEYGRRTPMWRVVCVTTLTPVLVALLINTTDAIPLQAPVKGLRYSGLLWVRLFVSIFCINGPSLLQLRIIVPELKLRLLEAVLVNFAGAFTFLATEFDLANLIGYPVPFGLVLGTPTCVCVIVAGVVLPRYRELRANTKLRQDLADYMLVWVCQVGFTVIYPAYNYVFRNLTSHAQTAFALLLPILKLVNKNWISHSLREADDVKPELVVFNIEVFHAMYTSLCMQSSSSTNTTIVLMIVDFLQAWLSVRDVNAVVHDVNHLLTKVTIKGCRPSAGAESQPAEIDGLGRAHRNILEVAMEILAQDPHLRLHPSLQQERSAGGRSRRLPRPGPSTQSVNVTVKSQRSGAVMIKSLITPKKARVAAGNRGEDASLELTEAERLRIVQRALQLAFLTEFVVLVEYVEVIMPTIYNACVRGMIMLPNREFYSLLAGKTDEQLQQIVNSVALYGGLEFVSYVLFCMVLRWRVQYSVLTQIAFVLEKQFVMVQSKLVMWVFYIVQSSLYHFGADFSFSFSWLHDAA